MRLQAVVARSRRAAASRSTAAAPESTAATTTAAAAAATAEGRRRWPPPRLALVTLAVALRRDGTDLVDLELEDRALLALAGLVAALLQPALTRSPACPRWSDSATFSAA